MKRKLTAFLASAVMLCIALLTAMPVSAERAIEDYIQNVGLYDPDGFFTEEQCNKLDARIQEASRKIDMYAAVVVYDESGLGLEDETVETYAKQHYIDLFEKNTESDTDGVILVLNMQTHYIYIATSALGAMYYSNSSEDRYMTMEDNMKPYLRSDDTVGAIEKFCYDLEYYYQKGIPEGAYCLNEKENKYFYIQEGKLVTGDKLPLGYGVDYPFLTGVSIVIAAIITLITYAVIKSSYKMKKSLDPSNYISQKETNFYERHDVFIRAHTSKTRIDTDSGSGGSGGSMSSFGGHSFGGGGSHW